MTSFTGSTGGIVSSFLAWFAAIEFLVLGALGMIYMCQATWYAYSQFGYLGHGYWYKKAISWVKAPIMFLVTVGLLTLGIISVVTLANGG